MVGKAGATMVESSVARNIASITPMTMLRLAARSSSGRGFGEVRFLDIQGCCAQDASSVSMATISLAAASRILRSASR